MVIFNHNNFLSSNLVYNELSPIEIWEKYRFSKNTKNSTQLFFTGDSEERFKNNLNNEHKFNILKKCGWADTPITYKFNNYGFRSNDDYITTDLNDIPMFIGGSIVEAVGVNIEDSYAYKIAKKLNSPIFYNISQSGVGIENTYRLFKSWCQVSKPSVVFWFPTPEPRREFIVDDRGIVTISAWSTGKDLEFFKYVSCSDDINIHTMRLVDSIKNVARETGTELYIPSREVIEYADKCGAGFIARDFVHPSVQWHDALSEKMYEWKRIV